jgi:hypothetical protein
VTLWTSGTKNLFGIPSKTSLDIIAQLRKEKLHRILIFGFLDQASSL